MLKLVYLDTQDYIKAFNESDNGPNRTALRELAEFRKAAEAAAIELRRGGELAFYYHGPERSTVTVGLFTQKDLNDGTGGESDDLREARQKHPSALVNGMGLRQSEIVPGTKKKGELQKSFLVTVPKK